jgi:hypothetical protein
VSDPARSTRHEHAGLRSEQHRQKTRASLRALSDPAPS